MKKFLNHIQLSYGYSNYEIQLIEYFILSMASDLSKLIIIFSFFAYRGQTFACSVALVTLLLLRLSGGGFHCEHYITCLLTSFSFIYGAVTLSGIVPVSRSAMVCTLILCGIIVYQMVPVVSFHRPAPSRQLIRRSRNFSFVLLGLSFGVVLLFHNHPFAPIIYWVWVLHSAQLLIIKFNKGGKYHVT